MMVRSTVLCAALLTGIVACARHSAPNAAPAITQDNFRDVLAKWSRSTKVYSGLDARLFVTATYHTPEFRRAFASAFPDIYGRGGEVTKRELVELTGDVEQFNTFFIVAYTPAQGWNDFEKTDSIWSIKLRNGDGAEVLPHEVIAVKTDENLRTVYGHLDQFSKAYLVRFPLTDPMGRILIDACTKTFTLRIASALGAAELNWQVATAD
jgi:hypothetical protein